MIHQKHLLGFITKAVDLYGLSDTTAAVTRNVLNYKITSLFSIDIKTQTQWVVECIQIPLINMINWQRHIYSIIHLIKIMKSHLLNINKLFKTYIYIYLKKIEKYP